MAKAQEVDHASIMAVMALAYAANYIAAKYWGYPFLYCWLSPAAVAVYMAVGTLTLYAAAIGVIIGLFRKSPLNVVLSALIGVAVIELPHLCNYLFRLGASCV